jgi:hypothetical protein
MRRGPRSPVIMPRTELTWLPVDGSNCAVLLTLDHCGCVGTFGHEDVRRLDVAVDEALLVRSYECVRHDDRDFNHPIDGKRVFLHQVVQRFAIHELRGDERTAAYFSDLMNCADLGITQRAEAARASRRKSSSAKLPGR